MHGRLMLTSSFADVSDLLAGFERHLRGKRVAFIPTANNVETISLHVRAGRKAFDRLGLVVEELDIAKASHTVIRKAVQTADIIYVSGGNTFYLLQEMKRTGADRLIVDEVGKGKLYIGESAGTVVASPNIAYIAAMDPMTKAPHLRSFDALGLVDFYVVPHYGNRPFTKAAHAIVAQYAGHLAVRPMSNDEVLFVEDGDATLTRR